MRFKACITQSSGALNQKEEELCKGDVTTWTIVEANLRLVCFASLAASSTKQRSEPSSMKRRRSTMEPRRCSSSAPCQRPIHSSAVSARVEAQRPEAEVKAAPCLWRLEARHQPGYVLLEVRLRAGSKRSLY